MARIERIARNTQGRDLIVGDIHGYFSKLQRALDAVGFNPTIDRLFSVGDLVDRGPENDQVLEWLARPWFYAVCGNHDDMAIRWPNGNMNAGNYIGNGGAWNIANPDALQREIAESMSALPLGIELETEAGLVGIVHAECPFDDWNLFRSTLADATQSRARIERIEATAQWSRNRIDYGDRSLVRGVHAVVVGHTPVPEHIVLGNVHYIDTGAWICGQNRSFTLLDAATLTPAAP